MPSSVLIDGKQYYKPGVYGQPDASKVGGKGVSFGKMAVVGAFPQLPNDVAYEFSSPAALTSFDPTSLEFARLAKLAFKPRVGASGASSLTLLNVGTVTQAYRTFLDGSGVDSLKLTSKLAGIKGNQVFVKIAANITAGQDITITLPGFPGEQYVGLTTGNVIEFLCDTAVCTDLAGASDVVEATITQSAWQMKWEKRLTNGVAFVPTLVPVASKLYVRTAAPTGITIAFGVTGSGLKNGVAWSGTASFDLVNGSQNNTFVEFVDTVSGHAIVWSEITNVTNNAAGSTSDLRGWAIDTSLATNPALSTFTYLSDAANYINNLNNKGFYATIKNPLAYRIPVAEFEQLSPAASIKATSQYIKADVWYIIQQLAASGIVVATRPAGSTRAPANTTGKMLVNGTESAVSVAVDYADGLSKLENVDLQRMVVLSDDIEAGKALVTHCYNAAVKFGRDRNGWFGCPGGTSLTNIKQNYVNKLDNRNVALVADKIQIAAVKAGDSTAWLEPKYLAVLSAGLQCGLPPARALTTLVPDILDISHAWTDGTDEDQVIAGSICALAKNNNGVPAYLRSVTTWTRDDNPAYCEVSGNDSVNTSIRDLRAHLINLIGESIDSDMETGSVEAMVKDRLEYQVNQKWIKSYADVAVVLVGDKYSVDYLLDAVLPVNFIVVTPHVGG